MAAIQPISTASSRTSTPALITIMPNMDSSTLANALNTNFKQIQSESRRKTISDENGQTRIILGKQDDGSYNLNVYDNGDTTFTTANKTKFLISGPLEPTLSYTASSGGKWWVAGDAVPVPIIPFTDNPETPDIVAYITDIDSGGWNTKLKLPYIENDSSGNIILKIDAVMLWGPSYWTPTIHISIPSSSSYYAGNHTFSFLVNVFNT